MNADQIHGPLTLFGLVFEDHCTGGNCMALRADLDDEVEVLITGGDADLPTRSEWVLSFFSKTQGHQIGFVEQGKRFQGGES